MALNPSIFKAYDIRGVYPEDFSDRTGYRVAQALVRFTKAHRVVLGYDARTSSPALVKEVREGLRSTGVEIIDVGLVTTPMFYFAVASDKKVGAGIMVTASHNPAKYNGFKLVAADAVPIGGKSGMDLIKEYAQSGPYPAEGKGKLVRKKILNKYLVQVFKVAGVKKLPIKVVIDAGNGMVGMPLKTFIRRAGLRAQVLYGEVDCSFPNHEANPIKDETLKDLKMWVKKSRAKAGIAFDGDADRVGFIDERGERVPGDIIGALIATELLKASPAGLVLGGVNVGWDMKEAVEAAGGRFALTPVGHANIKRAMRLNGAIFAAEISYHFYYKSFYKFESTLLTTLLVLKKLLESGKPMSELLEPFRKYFGSGEINSEVEYKDLVMEKIFQRYRDEAREVNLEDGMRLDFQDWWFSVRPSNTEPLLRLNVEASSRKIMEEKREELLGLIRERYML